MRYLLPCGLALLGLAFSQTPELPLFLRYPDVSQDQIVFRYGGDLWLAPIEGGDARRLTSAQGSEALPKFSPDGQTVAFMAEYDGGRDIYTLPIDGGVPKRLTYHPGGETLNDWTPDGKAVLFHSNRESGQARAPKIFSVPSTTGPVETLPIPYGNFGALDATGTWLAYTPTSREFRTWKRYRGGLAQDIWLFNLETKESRQVTNDPGSDQLPMWHGSDLYFLSDRGDAGIPNLYRYSLESGETTAVTELNRSGVRFPSIGPEHIVFEWEGKLHRIELATGEMAQVPIRIQSDRPALRPVHHKLAGAVSGGTLSPNAKGVVMEARGELFLMATEEGAAQNLTQTSGSAERFPDWSPDGKHLAFWSDRSGEYELYLQSPMGEPIEGADPETGWRQLTQIGAGWKESPSWTPDGKHIYFSTSDGHLYVVDVAAGTTKLVTQAPFVGDLEVQSSPDSRWLTWSMPHPESRNPAIHLYDINEGELHVVTSGMFADSEPTFDLNGDWMYYLSARTFRPTYADLDSTWIYRDTREIVAVPLREDVESPFAPRDTRDGWGIEDPEEEDAGEEDSKDKEGSEDTPEDGDAKKEDAESKSDDKEEDSPESDAASEAGGGETDGESPAKEDGDADAKDEEGDEDEAPLDIDLEGFETRGHILDVDHKSIIGLLGATDGLMYFEVQSTGRGSQGGGATLMHVGLERELEPKKILDKLSWAGASNDREHLLVKSGPNWAVVEAKPGQKIEDPLDLSSVQATMDPLTEWRQMLRETYRLYRDFFYDPGMHGVDWEAEYQRYAKLLDSAAHREDVHSLIGELIAELNVGHAYNRGGDEAFRRGKPAPGVGLLGCDWELADGAWRVKRVLGTPYDLDVTSPLRTHGVNVQAGDILVSVDGQPVDASASIHKAFIGKAGRTVRLKFRSGPDSPDSPDSADGADDEEREVSVETLSRDSALRYRTWVHDMRAAVDAASKGQIGYVHVPDTGIRGQNELMRQFVSEHRHKALIIDERWNGGGQIPWRFVELLDRPTLNYWATRGKEPWDFPDMRHSGPKAMLINGPSGSGGDCFPYYFRQKKLGPLIGTRTWGGLVGISGNPSLVDGSNTSVPTFGFYELDGTWGIENHGVDPDIVVPEDPALMWDGSDPQIDEAVRYLMEELAKNPLQRPARPAGPNRSGAGIPMEDR